MQPSLFDYAQIEAPEEDRAIKAKRLRLRREKDRARIASDPEYAARLQAYNATLERREKMAAAVKRWRENNPEEARNKSREWSRKWREENPEEARAKWRKDREKMMLNQERAERRRIWMAKYYEEKQEHLKEYTRTWKKQNPEMDRAHGRTKRARKKQAPGAEYTTHEHITARWEYYGGRCYLCGSEADSIDHVIPLAKGGTHWPANLRPACMRCNSVKQAKWPYDIDAHRKLFSE